MINVFDLNGVILQWFVYVFLAWDSDLLKALVVVYPVTILFEVLSIGLVASYRPERLISAAYAVRAVSLTAIALCVFLANSTQLMLVLFLTAYFGHVLGFHACWPSIVRDVVPLASRGRILGLARAWTNGITLLTLATIAAADRSFGASASALVAGGLIIFLAILAIAGIRRLATLSGMEASRLQPTGRDVAESVTETMRALCKGEVLAFGLLVAALSLLTFPAPLIFLPEIGDTGRQTIMLGYILGVGLSVLMFPRFGLLLDGNERAAIRLIALLFGASTMTIAASMLLVDRSPAGEALVVVAILTNYLMSKAVGLLWYKRAIEITDGRSAGPTTILYGWISDIAAWLSIGIFYVALPWASKAPAYSMAYLLVPGTAAMVLLPIMCSRGRRFS